MRRRDDTLRWPARAVLLLAFLVVGVFGASAEVRLLPSPDGGAPDLDIVPASSGPWSLLGDWDPTVLNPLGDTLGDGTPGHCGRDEEGDLLAAWNRPLIGRILLAIGEHEWRGLPALPAPNAIGVPHVEAFGNGWALLWQAVDGGPVLQAAGAAAVGEVGVPETLLEGFLVDAFFANDEVQVIVIMTPDRRWIDAVGVVWGVPSVPSPVDILWRTRLGPAPPGDDPLSFDPELPMPPSSGRLSRLHRIQETTGGALLSLEWSDAYGRDLSVVLEADGLHSPVQVEGEGPPSRMRLIPPPGQRKKAW